MIAPSSRRMRAPLDLKVLVEEYERNLIKVALAVTVGHQEKAAELLGILPSTLCEKMKRLRVPSRRRLLAALKARSDAPDDSLRAPIASACPSGSE